MHSKTVEVLNKTIRITMLFLILIILTRAYFKQNR